MRSVTEAIGPRMRERKGLPAPLGPEGGGGMGYGFAVFRPVMSSAHASPLVASSRAASLASFIAAFVVAFVVVFLGPGSQASAHKNGVNTTSCVGCHTGGKSPTVTLTADAASPVLGQMVTLTITVTQTNGPTAGFYLTSDFSTPGTFKVIEAGTTTTTVGATHSMPRTGSGGITTFKVGWSSTVATGVQFSVYALSANGDGSSKGDGAGEAHVALVTGCTGTTYYIDHDADGYGTSDPRFESRKECAQPQNYSANGGDCDDFDEKVHPGAAEVCNGVDDNCDGMVDEGTGPQLCGSAAQTCVRGACSPPGPAGGTGSGGRLGGLGTGGSPGRDAGIGPGAGTGGIAGAVASGGATLIATDGSAGAASSDPARKDAGVGPGPGSGATDGAAAASGPTTPASGESTDSSVAGGCAVSSGGGGTAGHEGRWSWLLIASTLAAVIAGARRRSRRRCQSHRRRRP